LGFVDLLTGKYRRTASFAITAAQRRSMARRLRLESEAGVYHVIDRGNDRSPIFRAERRARGAGRCGEGRVTFDYFAMVFSP
jgi:hypothetical protein